MCLAIPGRVLERTDEGLAKVDFGGVRREVSIAFTPEVAVGDWVLVHVGFALARVDEEEAQATLQLLGDAIDAELAAGVGSPEPAMEAEAPTCAAPERRP